MVITVIGIGLIGGSMAISLIENGFATKVIGVDARKENEDKAIRRRLIDEALPLEEAVAAAQLVILATPVDAMLSLLPRVLDQIRPDQVLIEVGSTKATILEVVKDHPNRRRFVATHPMAGTEYSGPEAAIPGLFENKATVLVDVEDSYSDAVELVCNMYESIPMRVIMLDAKEHDIHTAYVSHISHISSFALALTVLEKEKNENRIFQLASGGFGSTVRLAKSSPEMWIPIFRQNRDNVLDVLDEHIHVLSTFRSLLIKRDFEKFHEMIQEANRIRRILS